MRSTSKERKEEGELAMVGGGGGGDVMIYVKVMGVESLLMGPYLVYLTRKGGIFLWR